MSRLPKNTSHELAEEVRQFLEAQFGSPPEGPNLYAAATVLGGTEPEGAEWQRDRTLLRRVALDRDAAGRYPRRLNVKTAERLIAMVAVLDPEKAEHLTRLLWDQQRVRAFLCAVTDQDAEVDWYAALSSLELDALLRPPTLEGRMFGSLPALKADYKRDARPYGGAAEQLVSFERWATRCGHSPWVVRDCLKRALAPLAAAGRTGGIFPAWEELTLRERRAFLYHALARERIALGDTPAEHRAVRGVLSR